MKKKKLEKSDLEKMFLNKKVKIISTFGPKLATYNETIGGVCTAIHEIPGCKNKFDIEINGSNGVRSGIVNPVIVGGKCVSYPFGLRTHPRTIELV